MKAIRLTVTAVLAFIICGAFDAALAQPGTLLSVTPTGTLSPAAINGITGGRFRNNGGDPLPARYSVESYLVTFESTGLDGEPRTITAQAFVPNFDEPARRPAFVFGPGSTGLVEACAPSRNYVDARTWDTYNAYTLAYAGQGFVSLMPNYMGFFGVGELQPYFSRVAEGRVMLDAGRAVATLLEDTPVTLNGVFVGGFSQGGHAAFAAADLAATYAPDVPLRGVVGFGPTTRLDNLFREFTYVAPWVIYSYNTFFGDRIDLTQVLAEPWLDSFVGDAERLCVLGAQAYYPSSPENLFTPAFTEALETNTLADAYPNIFELFEENNAGETAHGIPAIILQGVNDPVVSLESQNDFVRTLCENGSRVRYPNYLRTRHETRYIGFQDAMAWMESVANGEEPPSDCDLVE